MEVNRKQQYRSLLRFTTAGSVDDGKSTLIGRLLYDSKSIFEDQLEHITQSSKRLGKDEIDLSLLTDGLKAEREQGITIDVAYRYFSTPERKFIIADTPGHIQYTRNMVTGASTADLALILIDARKGVLEQTLRHSFIASLLDIRHFVFCINKMDMVNYSSGVFHSIRNNLEKIVQKLDVEDVHYIPISAKYGDNVVNNSVNMPWYEGDTLLRLLETVKIRTCKTPEFPRFPVQTVIRPQTKEFSDYRGYAGRVSGGTFKTGDEVMILPSMIKSQIKSIDFAGTSLNEASDGDSVTITLTGDIDTGRGNLIARSDCIPKYSNEIKAMICWFNEEKLQTGKKYLLRNHTNETLCIVKSVNFWLDINTLTEKHNDKNIIMNDIASVTIKTPGPLWYDSYRDNNVTGSFILVDEFSNETLAAGMIE